MTAPSSDGGVDIWVELHTIKIPIQCEQWKAKPVGVAAIREFGGAMLNCNSNCGIFASTSGFTSGAIEVARKNRIELWDLERILMLGMGHRFTSLLDFDFNAVRGIRDHGMGLRQSESWREVQ